MAEDSTGTSPPSPHPKKPGYVDTARQPAPYTCYALLCVPFPCTRDPHRARAGAWAATHAVPAGSCCSILGMSGDNESQMVSRQLSGRRRGAAACAIDRHTRRERRSGGERAAPRLMSARCFDLEMPRPTATWHWLSLTTGADDLALI